MKHALNSSFATLAAIGIPLWASRADITATIDTSAKMVTVNVSEGCTNDLSTCSNYDDVLAAVNGNTVATFCKTGRGGLYVTSDFGSYSGIFDITDGTFLIGSATALGPVCLREGTAPFPEGCPVWVRNGATLDNATGVHIGLFRTVYFEGSGVNGVGALVTSAPKDVVGTSSASCDVGTWGGRIEMTGDALIADVSVDGNRILCDGDVRDEAYLNMNGHALYIRARDGKFVFKDSCRINNPGDIFPLGRTQVFFDGYLKTAIGTGSYSSKRIYIGSENTVKMENVRSAGTNWTLVWSNACFCANGDAPYANTGKWDGSFTSDDTSSRRIWRGAVELLTDLFADTRCMNLSFAKAVSGPGGIRVNSTPIDDHVGPGELHLCVANSFAGGIVATNTRVTAWKAGAIPAGSSVVCSDSSLVFKEREALSLGSGSFSGSCTMSGTTSGNWSGALVKSGEGTLAYDSAVGASILDVRGGTVALGVLDDEVLLGQATRGLIGGHRYFPNSADAMNFLTNSTATCTNLIENTTGAAYDWYNRLWSKFDGETTTSHYVLTYSGYINNPSVETANWTFLGGVANMSRLLIDDVEVFVQRLTNEAEIKTIAISPGWHKFNLRLYHQYNATKDGRDAGGGGTAGPTNVVKKASDGVGFRVDKQGHDSNVLADYEFLTDLDSAPGMTFRWTDLGEDPDPIHPITGEHARAVLSAQFENLSAAPGTAVSCASPFARTFDTVTGFTAFMGADVVIGEFWTVDCSDLMKSGASFTSDGKITFAEGAELRLVGPDGCRGHGKVFTIMTAANGIEGMPKLVVPEGAKTEWKLSKSVDGKSIILTRTPLGILLIVR